MVCEGSSLIAPSVISPVLILVLMEYGLRERYERDKSHKRRGLNPCLNGIWSARQPAYTDGYGDGAVLILVLMEYGLRDIICYMCVGEI